MPENSLKNTLLSILVLLRNKAEEKGVEPVISTQKLSNLLQVSGIKPSQEQLSELLQNPEIAPFIASEDDTEVRLKQGGNEDDLDLRVLDGKSGALPDDDSLPSTDINQEDLNALQLQPQTQVQNPEENIPITTNPVPTMARRALRRSI